MGGGGGYLTPKLCVLLGISAEYRDSNNISKPVKKPFNGLSAWVSPGFLEGGGGGGGVGPG